jgi:hypothetical protein
MSSDEPEYTLCPYPYGTAEHLAWSLREEFNAEVAGYALWAIDQDTEECNIAFFLDLMYERFGLTETQYTAQYLSSFDILPPIMPETRKQLIINRVERDLADAKNIDYKKMWDGNVTGGTEPEADKSE